MPVVKTIFSCFHIVEDSSAQRILVFRGELEMWFLYCLTSSKLNFVKFCIEDLCLSHFFQPSLLRHTCAMVKFFEQAGKISCGHGKDLPKGNMGGASSTVQ